MTAPLRKKSRKGFWVLSRALVACLAVVSAAAAEELLDPAFEKAPLEQWLAGRDQARFQWSVRTGGGDLAPLQRLTARVEITVDGNEIAKRRGSGALLFFVQFSDSDHRKYQAHASIPFSDVTEAASKSNFVLNQNAFVIPGDYRVIVGILDTHTGEHAAVERVLRIGPLKNDPLPESWRAMPSVEFAEAADPPDEWFQPQLTGRLHLPVETRQNARIEVLANVSPSALGPRYRTGQVNNRSMADVLPSLKVLSNLELKPGVLQVSLLDLTRRQVLFEQDGLNPERAPLDWPRLREALLEANPNKIDVHELADHEQNAQFFVEEVKRRILAEPAPAALIILTGPMSFPRGADMHPIELTARPQTRIFYVRYHPPPMRVAVASSQAYMGRRRGFGQSPSELNLQEPFDMLEPLLKPVEHHIFEVYDAGQFRKALAEIVKEIGRQ